ncbi:hypothetical protein LINPERPRIM_LOCUS27941 [Linum perenne]
MSSQAKHETQAEKSHGGGSAMAETKVNSVDYRSSAGQGQGQEPKKVEVIHQTPTPSQPKSNTSGGVLASAAASVATTLQNAKEAISGTSSSIPPSSDQSR